MVVGILSSCGRVLFSSCEEGDSSLVVMSRGAFSSCDVQEATLKLWQWESSFIVAWWAPLLVAGVFCLTGMCGHVPS